MISITLPVYNEKKEDIDKTINSILNQTFQDFELLIVDDGSKKEVSQYLKHWAKRDKRIKYYYVDPSPGIAKALNKGLAEANYDLIATIGASDWWEPNFLEIQVNFFKKHRDYTIVGTNCVAHNIELGNTKIIKEPKNDSKIRKINFIKCAFVHASVVFRKFENIKYDETLIVAIDYDLYWKMLNRGKGHNIQAPLTHYTTHRSKNAISTRMKSMQLRSWIDIKLKYFEKMQPNISAIFYLYHNITKYLIFFVLFEREIHWLKKLRIKIHNRIYNLLRT